LPINFSGKEIVIIRGQVLAFGFSRQEGNVEKFPVL